MRPEDAARVYQRRRQTHIEDSKVAWLYSRCRAMSQARTHAAREGISEEWWTATPFRNPFIAAELEEMCSGLNAAWKRGQTSR